jgi:hypothetical protein
MRQIEACAPVAWYPDRARLRAFERGASIAPELSVEVTDAHSLAELRPHWSDLIGRADACNVFT